MQLHSESVLQRHDAAALLLPARGLRQPQSQPLLQEGESSLQSTPAPVGSQRNNVLQQDVISQYQYEVEFNDLAVQAACIKSCRTIDFVDRSEIAHVRQQDSRFEHLTVRRSRSLCRKFHHPGQLGARYTERVLVCNVKVTKSSGLPAYPR